MPLLVQSSPLDILVYLFVLMVNSPVPPHWKTLELVTLSQKLCTQGENCCQLDALEPAMQSSAPGIATGFKLADYKTFRERSRWPLSAVLVHTLCALASLQKEFKKKEKSWMEIVNKQAVPAMQTESIHMAHQTALPCGAPTTVHWCSGYRYRLLVPLLKLWRSSTAWSLKQPDKQLAGSVSLFSQVPA